MPEFVTTILGVIPSPPFQLYELPPDAVNVMDKLEQLISLDGLLVIVTTGNVFTFMTPDKVATAQLETLDVAVKLNTPDCVGVPLMVKMPAL